MTNKQLANIITDYIPYWEQPHTERQENYNETLNTLNTATKKELQEFYDYFKDDNETETLKIILTELEKRIKE